MFDDILSFSSNIIFSCILLFLFEKYCLHVFQNGLELQSRLRFSKYCNLAFLFKFVSRFCFHLNLTMSLGCFDLFALFLRHDMIIICFRRFSLKWGFWIPPNFFFLEACLSKIERQLFLNAARILIAGILFISNLNWALSYCLKSRYVYFFGSNFSNIVLRIIYITCLWSLKPVSKEFAFINKNFEFVISKSMHGPPSPLRHVLCFIIL